MRIAIVGPTYPYKGGIAAHTTELAHRFSRAGHDVELLSWSAQYPAFLYPGQQRTAEADGEPFPATTFPLAWYRPDSWVRVGRRLGRSDYDLVVIVVVTPVQAPAYLSLLGAMGKRRGGRRPKVVALCHNVLPHEQRRGDRRLVTALLDRVDSLLVHSPDQAKVAAGLTDTPAAVADLPPFTAAPPRAPTREGKAVRRLLFFGIVRPYKGLDVLLRALATVPDVGLTVAGEFWGGSEGTRALVAELGLADRVELRDGYVPSAEFARLFEDVDAAVLPYRAGTSTQNGWLALAHGVPVIATDAGTLPDQVRDGVDGLVVPAGEVAPLADAIRRLYDEPGLLDRLRGGIEPGGADAPWKAYLDALVATESPHPKAADTDDDTSRGERPMAVAAPPGGRALEYAKRVAERVLWARVGARTLIERRVLPGGQRAVPTLVAPTAVLRTRAEADAVVSECRRLRLPLHRDKPKNWDALGAVAAVVSRVGRDARVVDAGAARYSSVLPWLRLFGLTDLLGINLEFGNEARRGPVRFAYGDVTQTGFDAGSFDAVTCMSVIEHGVPVRPFLAESARILRPGGVLCVSTDFDKEPPDTTGKTAYGVPVHIFSPDEIKDLVRAADEEGLELVGDLALDHDERPVHWPRTGLDYTFILLTFVRR